jgi:hypothetical protein
MSRTLRRLIPSPAMIVALVALVMSLGSSAYALGVITGQDIQDNSVTGTDIHERSLRGHDLRKNSVGRLAINESRLRSVHSAKGLKFWAVVDSDGDFMRGHGLVDAGDKAVHTSPGNYHVIFKRDVRNCSYQATIGSPGTALPDRGQIIVAAHPNIQNAVRVRTADGMSNVADRAFQLAVIC